MALGTVDLAASRAFFLNGWMDSDSIVVDIADRLRELCFFLALIHVVTGFILERNYVN